MVESTVVEGVLGLLRSRGFTMAALCPMRLHSSVAASNHSVRGW